jgi:hypothetical protein
MGGCVELLRNLVVSWFMARFGFGRLIGCGCLLLIVAGLCVFALVNGTLNTLF